MPITKSAKKALRVSRRRRVFNLRRQATLRDVAKKIKKLIGGGQMAEAAKLVPVAYQAIDKAKKRGLFKANSAARRKSRLVTAISKISKK